MDTIEYATFRYDTVKVENGLKAQRRHYHRIMIVTEGPLRGATRANFFSRTCRSAIFLASRSQPVVYKTIWRNAMLGQGNFHFQHQISLVCIQTLKLLATRYVSKLLMVKMNLRGIFLSQLLFKRAYFDRSIHTTLIQLCCSVAQNYPLVLMFCALQYL